MAILASPPHALHSSLSTLHFYATAGEGRPPFNGRHLPVLGISFVSGHYRHNPYGGYSYVQPHYRTHADTSFYNNWSTYPNINPYTGSLGTHHRPSYGYGGGLGAGHRSGWGWFGW